MKLYALGRVRIAHAIICSVAALSGTANAAETNSTNPPWLTERLAWFQDQKFGLLMHWGPYSQMGYDASWPIIGQSEKFKQDYFNLDQTFNPTNFAPSTWAEAAKYAGMKYVVFTTKHHDGFCLFDTHTTDFKVTAPNVPFHASPQSNIVSSIFAAFRQQGFGIGAYFSKADWHSPDYWNSQWPATNNEANYDTQAHPERWSNFVAYTDSQIRELMTGYGPIDILWLDAGWVRPPKEDLRMDDLVAMARQYQPHLIVVDRTVGGANENYRTPEQEVPDKPLPYPWETCMTMGSQWSFKPNDHYKSSFELIHLLVDIVGKGGNFLLNVGPQPDGKLPAEALARLHEIGDWIAINGSAVYGTRFIAPYKDGQLVYTQKGRTTYAIYLPETEKAGLPERVFLTGSHPEPASEIHLLGVKQALTWKILANGTTVVFVPEAIRQAPPCQSAFAFEFQRAE